MSNLSTENASSADKAAPNEAKESTSEENLISNSNTASDVNLGDDQPNAKLDGLDSKDSDSTIAPSQDERDSPSGIAQNKQTNPIAEDLKRKNVAKGKRTESPPPPPVVSGGFEIKEEDGDDKKDEASIARERDDSPVAKPKRRITPKPTPPITTRGMTEKSRKKLGDAESRQGATPSKAKKPIPSRRVGNKTFTHKNNTWTDSAYKNQRTTTVKRKTTQYRKLDAGLQSIGNQLDGTVVVVWKSKAYKIQ